MKYSDYIEIWSILAPVSFRGHPRHRAGYTESDYVVLGSPNRPEYYIVEPTFFTFPKKVITLRSNVFSGRKYNSPILPLVGARWAG